MSFYGSVYYQLVDTFYKVITKNANLTGATFPEDLNSDDQTIQALGRKGVLKIANGNKWINFTYNEDDNSFMVWHGKPDDGVTTEVSGYKDLGQTKPDITDIVELEAGDYFSTFTSKYDEAGHLVPDSITTQYFKLPKSEVQDDVDLLLELVGSPATVDETGTPVSSTGLFAITDAQQDEIETNDERLILLEDFYGDSMVNVGRVFFPESGSMDLDEYTETSGKYQYKNFPKAFGSIDAIRSKYFGNAAATETVSDAIIRAYDMVGSVQTDNNNNATLIEYLTQDVNSLKQADVAINSEITVLKEADTTLSERIDNLNSIVSSNKEACDANLSNLASIVSSNKTACDENVVALQAVDTAIRAEFASADSNLKSDIAQAYANADTELKNQLTEAYGNADNVLKTEITEAYIAADSTLKADITKDYEAADSALKADITKDYEAADSALKADIKTAYEAADTTLSNSINEVSGRVTTLSNSVDEVSSRVTTLENANLIERLTTVETTIGTTADSEENPATGLQLTIANLQEQISALEARIAALESPSVE